MDQISKSIENRYQDHPIDQINLETEQGVQAHVDYCNDGENEDADEVASAFILYQGTICALVHDGAEYVVYARQHPGVWVQA